MFGCVVRIYFTNRDKYIEFKVRDVTPDSMTTAWGNTLENGSSTFVVTDQHGARATIHVNKVDLFAVGPWNGV